MRRARLFQFLQLGDMRDEKGEFVPWHANHLEKGAGEPTTPSDESAADGVPPERDPPPSEPWWRRGKTIEKRFFATLNDAQRTLDRIEEEYSHTLEHAERLGAIMHGGRRNRTKQAAKRAGRRTSSASWLWRSRRLNVQVTSRRSHR